MLLGWLGWLGAFESSRDREIMLFMVSVSLWSLLAPAVRDTCSFGSNGQTENGEPETRADGIVCEGHLRAVWTSLVWTSLPLARRHQLVD